uniref:Small cystein-rich protein n=1 Tax=Brassica campestris TaxID=3711 RepID=A0A146J584_BRACM|nr:small cystein-rich protein [Brassica rapa]
MKNSFQPSIIGFFMVTVLLFGVMTTAQAQVHRFPCEHIYRPKNGKCNTTICSAECTKERGRLGIGRCMDPQNEMCACMHYQRHRKNECLF